MGLKERYAHWQIVRKSSPRQRRYVGLDDKTPAIILLDARKMEEARFGMLDAVLKRKFRNFSYVVFQNKKNPLDLPENAFSFSTENVCFGIPKKEIQEKFSQIPADLLIDLTLRECLPLKFLLGVSPAACKCGACKPRFPYYDFEIKPTYNLAESELLECILSYLETIQPKK